MIGPVELGVAFSLGLVSSLHCAQMCGPLVLAYSLPLTRRSPWPHLAYNTGRLATYSLLGALAGAAGGGLISLGRIAGVERAAAMIAGIAMMVAGILMSGWLPKQTLVRIGGNSRLWRPASALLRSPAASSKLALGAVLGLLPCGLVYAALIKALDAGSALGGALTMLAFGAGTASALLGIGLFSTAITARFGRHANRFATVSILLLGAFLLWRGYTGTAPGCSHYAS
jgi:sulfite exporter TauE/SafE